MAQEVFWRRKSLNEMTAGEWESLCDGCALCCLHKVEDEDTQEVFYTTVVCHLLEVGKEICVDERISVLVMVVHALLGGRVMA